MAGGCPAFGGSGSASAAAPKAAVAIDNRRALNVEGVRRKENSAVRDFDRFRDVSCAQLMNVRKLGRISKTTLILLIGLLQILGDSVRIEAQRIGNSPAALLSTNSEQSRAVDISKKLPNRNP